MSTTIQDYYEDTVQVSPREGGGVYLDCTEDDRETQFAFESDQTRELIDALAAHAALTVNPPAGAVKASDIPLNEALIRVAAAHGIECSFRYAKGDGSNIEFRTFVPSNVNRVGDHVTFTGYDPDREDYRAYRSDRIKGTVTVGG